MRTVLLDIGPLAHLSGKGALTGTDLLNYELLTSPAGTVSYTHLTLPTKA